jgi:hypothetical protein
MATASSLDQGREAFARKAWGDAYAQLQSAARAAPLTAEDLERLAMAAHMLGRDGETGDLFARAHHEFLARGEIERAARAAIWLSFSLQTKGELAQGGGWIARARRLLEDAPRDCVEQGCLLVPTALRHFFQGDPATARATFAEAVKIGERFRDRDLITMGRNGQGRSLIAQSIPLPPSGPPCDPQVLGRAAGAGVGHPHLRPPPYHPYLVATVALPDPHLLVDPS